jgi:archaellum biogenesis protein FlaJ (TadC family)
MMKKIKTVSVIGVLPATAIGVFLPLLGIDPALSLLISGIPIAIAGRLALRMETKLLKYDDIFPTFLRSLGHILSTSPSLEIALETILRIPLGILRNPVERMYRRLKMGVPTFKSWHLFLEDISTYMSRATGIIFYHTFSRFGDIKEVSDYLGMLSLNIMDLRRLRIQLAKGFEATILIIHILISIVVGLISSLVIMFGEFLAISGYVAIPIAPLSKDIMDLLNYITLLTASIVNGLIARSTFPGSIYPATWYIGLFMIIGFGAFYGSEQAITRFIGVFVEDASELIELP